jgi:hypothetical protein
MSACSIAPKDKICVRTNITIPYIKYLSTCRIGYGFLPDWIVLRIEGDFYIAGTRQAVPISLNAYVDPNLIKQKEFDI